MVPSIIGEDLMITGNVTSKGEIQVDGEIQGDINCGSLLLGDKSQVTGSVIAEDIVVRGRVIGSIRGLRVTLQAQSHVEGDIFHQSLAIEQGAYFEGKSRRSDDPLADSRTRRPHEPASRTKAGKLRSAADRARHHQLRQRLGPLTRAPRSKQQGMMTPRMGRPLCRPALCFRVGVDALGERSLDEAIDVAVENSGWVGALDAGPQVLHQLIGLEHVRPDLMAEADIRLGGCGCLRLLLPPLELGLIEPRAEHRPCGRPVLVLRPLVLTGDDDVGRRCA